ncbi:MAG TPA: tetratricopeptide repeat protein, partial [Chroococcales cyanobacterium]
MKALAKDPDDRYQTMLEMKEALEAVKSGKSTVEQQMSTTFDMPVATETTADMKKEVAHVSEALKNKEQAPAPDSAGTADATTGFAAASGNAAATISTTASGTNIPALSAPSSSDNPSASTPSGTFSSLPGLTVSASGPLHTASPAPLGAGTPVIPTHGAAPVAPNAVKDLMKRPWFPYAVGGAIATIGTIFFMSLIPGKQNPAHVPGTVSDLGHSSSPTGKPAALNGTETAAQLNDGAQQDLDNNRFKEALTAATMALDKATKSNNVPEKIRAIDMLSEAHFALAEYDKATKECHTVIVLSGEDAKTPMVANALNRLGKMEIARGQLDEASRDLTKALAIREKFTGPEHAAVVNSYSALGDLAMHQNKYKDAIKYLEKASMIASSTMGADDPSTAMIQNQLGQAYTGMGNYTLARTYYQKALDSRLKAFGPDDATVADSYTCLGSLEFVKRNTKASEDYFKKAEAIYAKSIGLNNLQSAVVEFCLGVINEKNKNWSTAADYYKRCLTARQTQLNSTDPKVKQ